MNHRVLLTFLASAFVLARVASAQATYELLHRFERGAYHPVGRLAEAPDGSLFGMTYSGGRFDSGTIFALRPSPGGPWSAEIVREFRIGVEGAFPWGSLISGRDGNFYGLTTTTEGPTPNARGGTMFRLTPSGDFSLLHTFSYASDMPVWRLLEASDGNFYGSTCGADDTTIFRITPTGAFTALYRLYLPQSSNPYALGVCPVTELWEGPDGFLYGQATYAGPFNPVTNGGGTLFRIDPRGSSPQAFALLHAFSGPDGAQPVGGLVPGPGGALHGSAYQAGPFGKGSIFRLEPTGGVTTVHAFEGADGAHPYGGLFATADGSLYGTASEGGTGFGTLFKIDAGGQFSRLHAFNGADGRAPVELMQARDGRFYGVTYYDGPGGGGTAFRLNPDNSVETLHAFAAGPEFPLTGVIEAADGNFYGTTRITGTGDGGTVFKLSPDRQLTVLHDFGPRGAPSGLIQAADGYLYGTTSAGGAHDKGTVFRIGPTGGHTVFHSFACDPACMPQHGVTQASDGNFYGTTILRNPPDLFWNPTTLFRVDASGNLTTLRAFTRAEGFDPSGPLVEGTDGSLYGTMNHGGLLGHGTVFKVTTSGAFTLLHSFSGHDGSGPSGGLTRAGDGRLYGVTSGGGEFHGGTLFRLEVGGGVTTLHSFSYYTDGSPTSALAGRDGALYGVAVGNLRGEQFFRFTTTGLTIVFDPVPVDDGIGISRLFQGSDGAFYGTVARTVFDSWFEGGGVFRLNVPPVP